MFHHLDITSCHARALSRAYGMLMHCHGFVKKIINFKKKNYMEKHYCIPQCFQEKLNYKLNS